MNVKIKSALVVAVLALVAMTGFVTTVYSDTADAAIGEVNIEVDQVYTYDVIFNVSTALVTDVTVDSGDTFFTAVMDASPTKKVIITGTAAGTGKFTITGTSSEFTTNTTTQEITVNVVAALAIIESELTFYKDVAGSEAYVTSTNGSTNVVYSAKNLPAGLHMDAGGNGLIYGKATTEDTTGTAVAVTATNTVTKVSVTKDVTVKVLADPFEFTLTPDGTNVIETSGKYYVVDNKTTYSFTVNKPFVAATEWSIQASGDFNSVIDCVASNDDGKTKLTFAPTSGTFALSGDYVVVVTHKVLDTTTVATGDYRETQQSVVMHFQAGLAFDTAPEASMNVSYTGMSIEAVV